MFHRKLAHILSHDTGLQQLRLSLTKDSGLLTHKRRLVQHMEQ